MDTKNSDTDLRICNSIGVIGCLLPILTFLFLRVAIANYHSEGWSGWGFGLRVVVAMVIVGISAVILGALTLALAEKRNVENHLPKILAYASVLIGFISIFYPFV